MMTQQARDSFPPVYEPAPSLRSYPADSPRAKARLIVLALFADGRVDGAELDALTRRGAFAELGITRDDFFEVLYDFCIDVAQLPNGSGHYLVAPAVLESLFAELRAPQERQALLRLIFDVIRSDGHLADGEARLFWNALDAWKLTLEHGARGMRRPQRWPSGSARTPAVNHPLRKENRHAHVS